LLRATPSGHLGSGGLRLASSDIGEASQLLVDSTFTVALLTGMSVSTVSAKAVANLGWDKVRATAPVFAGDTLYAESKVLEKRESKSRHGQGIVTVETRGLNQDGAVVMTFERTMLCGCAGTRRTRPPATERPAAAAAAERS
jgi:acyl dehydratase